MLTPGRSHDRKRIERCVFHRIKNVAPSDGFRLSVEFREGGTKIYDVRPLFGEIPVFRSLEDNPSLFPKGFVGTGGYGIVWNDEIDPACDELRENGEAVETPSCG